jgi:hypothetical protein
MKIISVYLFLIIVVLASCRKSINNVHFRGRVLLSCNGQPAKNIQLAIYVDYDNGSSGSDEVCSTTTDNDGNYSVIADVSYKGGIDEYKLNNLYYSDSIFRIDGYQNGTNSKDILMDGTAYIREYITFHIKNVNPNNGNDILNDLRCGNSLLDQTGNLEFIGQNIDTTFSKYVNIDGRYITFSYRVFKGAGWVSHSDSVQTVCYDNTLVEIFY